MSIVKHAHSVFCDEISMIPSVHAKFPFMQTAVPFWEKLSVEEVLAGFQETTIQTANYRDQQSQLLGGSFDSMVLPWLYFDRKFKIPAKLLRGPWPREKELLLFWLCGHGASVKLNPLIFIPSEEDSAKVTQMIMDAVKDNKSWIVEKCIEDEPVAVIAAALRQALAQEPFPFNVVSHLLGAMTREELSSDELAPIELEVENFLAHRKTRESELASSLDHSSTLMAAISTAKWTRAQVARWWRLRQLREDNELEDIIEDDFDGTPYSYSITDIYNVMEDFDTVYFEGKRIEDLEEESRLHDILMIDLRPESLRVSQGTDTLQI